MRGRLAFLIGLFWLSAVPLSAQTLKVQEVVSAGGIKALLVQDDKLPIIALHFAFRGGVEQDPANQQGLASLTMSLLTEGAGEYDAATFQQRLADQSISLGFGAGRDALGGSLKTLVENKQEAFRLLRLVLTQPRFDEAAITRVKTQQLTQIKFQLSDPSWQARYALLSHVFAGHPYSQRSLGTVETLARINRADLQRFAQQHLAQDNLVVGVAGKITPDELKRVLDEVFGSLPQQAQLKEIPEASWLEQSATLVVARPGTQSELLFAVPSLKRKDPDWYAASLINYTLGGGGFASQLMKNVREKQGLTYGISTALSPMDHAAMLVGTMAAENSNAGKAWAITRSTWQKLFDKGIDQASLDAAKAYLIGELPLQLTSTSAIAGYLVTLQQEGLPKDFLEQRQALYNGVSPADINRVIQRWFDPKNLTLAVVGQPAGITGDQQLAQVQQ